MPCHRRAIECLGEHKGSNAVLAFDEFDEAFEKSTLQSKKSLLIDDALSSSSSDVIEDIQDFDDIEDDDEDTVKPTVIATRTYDVYLTYDKYYRTPRLWLAGRSENGASLTFSETMEDINSDYVNFTVFCHSLICI